jgi:hypothetical protein
MRIKDISVTVLFIVIFLISGCLDSDYKMTFSIEQTGEPLDGDVYLYKTFLGSTTDGMLLIDIGKLHPGDIRLEGTYQEKRFVYEFELYETDLEEYYEIDFVVDETELQELSFESSKIDTDAVEDEIFDLINTARTRQGIELLKRSHILDEIAKEYSNTMVIEDFYAHTTPEGIDLHDRLNSREIFYFTATEDLNYIEVYSDTNLAKETVDAWIESPSHRVPILDTDDPIIWDSIGIGVSCIDKEWEGVDYAFCYVTAEFVGFTTSYQGELKENFLQFMYLYDPDLGLDFSTDITINFESSEKVDLFIVPDEEQFDNIINVIAYDTIDKISNTKSYQDTITILPGYGLIIDASDSRDDIEYSIELNYNM